MTILGKFIRAREEPANTIFRYIKGLILPVAMLVILRTFVTFSSGPSPASTPGSASQLWVVSGLVRVGKTDTPGAGSSISLSGARGETVDTQVVLQGPSSGLTNVNLSASALTGPGGATIPASNITLYREYYLSVTGTASYGGGSNPPPRSKPAMPPSAPARTNPTGSTSPSLAVPPTAPQVPIPAPSRSPRLRAMRPSRSRSRSGTLSCPCSLPNSPSSRVGLPPPGTRLAPWRKP